MSLMYCKVINYVIGIVGVIRCVSVSYEISDQLKWKMTTATAKGDPCV
jgi:hypothetical protein